VSFSLASSQDFPKKRPIFLAAGGSGGHMFPAIAMAHYAHKNNTPVVLITDARGARFIDQDKHYFIHVEILQQPRWSTFFSLYTQLKGLFKFWNPCAIVGFGGIMTIVPLLTGLRYFARCAIHQSDAVMGKANRLLSYFAHRVFLGHNLDQYVKKPSKKQRERWITVGTPTRSSFQSIPLVSSATKPLNILILGGSQGANIWSRVLPKATELLSLADQAALHIQHQCAPKDLLDLERAYQQLNLYHVHVSPFFSDMPQALTWAHVVFSRAGASTLAELSLAKRGALLVPYPHAAQNHQWANAQSYLKEHPGWLCQESDLTPLYVATLLKSWLDKPEQLVYGEKKVESPKAPDACSQLYQFCTAP
jgi:UDP-N-acetylglucosamine--N-acetylmuramyl-(pentapeptide) pyrophosphoryl-undecaprenol N-acetylglucosamine transferase